MPASAASAFSLATVCSACASARAPRSDVLFASPLQLQELVTAGVIECYRVGLHEPVAVHLAKKSNSLYACNSSNAFVRQTQWLLFRKVRCNVLPAPRQLPPLTYMLSAALLTPLNTLCSDGRLRPLT
ncbi:hypothetical protein RR46_03115 [Papilio xuthus]|uniref:Uncharacterized protein n=1 Tax=Papilio xuthus TaxID=66420 RepID=A0A194Q783_PAPXU|nr:hypothetical protein RR46_03115 [Papilio xuthus]